MINGIVNVYKEVGYTSFDVIAKLRGIVKQKKIGHTGTLDPNACGVLPVCFGNATKLCDMLTDKDKTYITTMQLGISTDSQDITGTVIEEKAVTVTENEVITAIESFVGEYQQIPPMYSALKVNGQKLCNLARQGIEVERKARPVNIYGINILEISLPYVTMEVECSKGTYIRTLCHDIGEKLGVGACVKTLERTKVSAFTKENSITLEQIRYMVEKGTLNEYVLPVPMVFSDYGTILVNESSDKLISNGNKFVEGNIKSKEPGKERLLYKVYYSNNEFVGVYEYITDASEYKPVKMFLS